MSPNPEGGDITRKYVYETLCPQLHLTKFLIGHLAFYASLESKNRLYNIHASIDISRLYRDSAGYSIQK